MKKMNKYYKIDELNRVQRDILDQTCKKFYGVSYFSLKMNDRKYLILPALLTLSKDEDVKKIIGYLLQENEYDVTSRVQKKYIGIFNEIIKNKAKSNVN